MKRYIVRSADTKTHFFVFLSAIREKQVKVKTIRRCGGSMIHRVYEKSGQNKEEGDKNQTGSQGEGWMRPLDSRCAMNSPEFFLADERKDRTGTVVPSLGIKRVLSSRGYVVVVTRLYTAVFDSLAIYHPFLFGPHATFGVAKNSRWKSDTLADRRKIELLELRIDLGKTLKFEISKKTSSISFLRRIRE